MEQLSAANNGFCIKLFQAVAKGNSNNIFFSPWSISSALGMVYQGTRGNTAAQMGKVLLFDQVVSAHAPLSPGMEQQVMKAQHHVPCPKRLHHDEEDDTRSILPAYRALSMQINKASSSYTLESASNMYVEQTYQVKKEFISDIKKYYGAEPQSVNFVAEAEKARQNINSWVEDKTHKKIENLLPAGALDSSTIMVLVNAIYFKGNWADKFGVEHTEEKEFRLSKTAAKPVHMMFKNAKFNIAHAELAGVPLKILDLPYVGKELSMIIILPDEIHDGTTGLEKLEQELSEEKMKEWTRPDKMENMEVEVSLPKFKLEEKYDMGGTLISLGMADAFSQGRADFSGMSDANDLFLSKVFHKAYVDVNEEGTEAAAATAAVLVLKMATMSVIFEANHPFLFYIRHNQSNTILFMGRCSSP
ncbi:leukocyte elastase inhibitor-like isoform X2 [Ambystoma mexicanum]|uniref:leukocyte elastase inhibitor-like isoform X2 n=1 Tax=Ambystoma mexicanum TaxID=8296 RepID=UPI0037E8B392